MTDHTTTILFALQWTEDDSRQIHLHFGREKRNEIIAGIQAARAAIASVQAAGVGADVADGLDAPTSPGWWAFEGKSDDDEMEYRTILMVLDTRTGLLSSRDGEFKHVSYWHGKWYKLVMPWERAEQPAPAVSALTINEYQLLGGGPNGRKSFTLKRMIQRDSSVKWAIYDGGSVVLSKEYEDGDPWEFEPSPSSRDDEYLARCRYDSIEEALEHWQKWLDKSKRPAGGQEASNG